MMRIEDTILRNLLFSDEFTRKSLPYLKKDYFYVRLTELKKKLMLTDGTCMTSDKKLINLQINKIYKINHLKYQAFQLKN